MARQILQRAALALALFAVGGQLFSVAHLLLVPHTVCAEHGELIHVEGVGSSAPSHEQDPTHSVYRPASGVDSADVHDHCLASATRREKVTLPAVQSASVPAYGLAASHVRQEALAPPRALGILAFAPKSSPPALYA